MKILSIPALACAMTLGFGLASAQAIAPTRVGPVSQYGELLTGKNSQGKGRIYGSCQGVKDGAEVQVRGMSLYWSLNDQALEFWTEEGIASMVKDMKIQLVRGAMATGNEDWTKGQYQGYALKPEEQKGFMKRVIEAAIKQDIYVIIDWHSHIAHEQVESAKGFFREMAQNYGQYDNVIFELFNEPACKTKGSGNCSLPEFGGEFLNWESVKNYANQVIPVIREYSDNLILVGNPYWDQVPNMAIDNEVTDSGKNTAYTFHYYAMTHCPSGKKSNGESDCEGENAIKAMNAGLSVFFSEWGTGTADGGGNPSQDNGANAKWQTFVDQNKISWANWSASKINEGTAAFAGSSNKYSLQYSTSGNMVKGYLASNPESYTKCNDGSLPDNQQQEGTQGLANYKATSALDVNFGNKALHVSGVDAANVELFDIKGHKLMMIDGVTGTLSLAMLPTGMYMVKVSSGSASMVKTIRIK